MNSINSVTDILGEKIVSWISSLSHTGVVGLVSIIGLSLVLLLGMVLLSHARYRNVREEVSYNENTVFQLGEELDGVKFANEQLAEEALQIPELQSELAALIREYELLKKINVDNDQKLFSTIESKNDLQAKYAALEATRLEQNKALEEKIELLNENRQQLTKDFELLANKIFEEKTQSFSKNSQQLIDVTLSPLKEQLNNFRQKVEETYHNEAKERHLLKGEIEKLREESIRISADASNLTKALKHENKTQGNWGELSLLRALEMCGLTEGVEFKTQVVIQEDGSKHIPDVVVHLPGQKDIIIDSKVSLLAYTRYFESEDEVVQQRAVQEHIASIKNHVKALSMKRYDNLLGLNTLDYVMLYVPVEGASMLALQNDLELWNYAYSKNIVLVGPSNLLAVLRSVETIWRHERQNKNAEKIATEAGKLHDQFILFAESLQDVGKQLDKARLAYDKANDRLVSGRGNLVKRITDLEKLGAKTQRKLPDALTDAANIDDVVAGQPDTGEETFLNTEEEPKKSFELSSILNNDVELENETNLDLISE